jgi:hypothetical protein
MRRLTGVPPAKETDLAALEAGLRSAFPADYRQFLLQENGGRLLQEYEFAVPGIGSVPLVDLFGVAVGGRKDIQFQAKRMAHMLPPNTIPVGSDPGGNLVCVDLLSGQVLFWSHEYSTPDEEEGETEFRLPLLAVSFREFLAALSLIAGGGAQQGIQPDGPAFGGSAG